MPNNHNSHNVPSEDARAPATPQKRTCVTLYASWTIPAQTLGRKPLGIISWLPICHGHSKRLEGKEKALRFCSGLAAHVPSQRATNSGGWSGPTRRSSQPRVRATFVCFSAQKRLPWQRNQLSLR